MAKHLTKCFVDLRRFGLASQRVAKLRLAHVERGFDVAALVIALHESVLIQRVEVIHARPPRIKSRCAI